MGTAQSIGSCGLTTTDSELIKQRLIQNKAFLKGHPEMARSRNAITYIPIKFHLAGKDDGSDRIGYTRVMDQLCLMNELFAEYEMQFYIYEGFNEINNTAILEEHLTASAGMAMGREKESRAVNVWILGSAQLEGSIGQTFGYYTPFDDWIVVDKLYISARGYTLPHELGHYFSLLHTFHGWGENNAAPYSETYEGKPAPATSPGGVLNEYADGSNCEIAGDMICDTPADYLYIEKLNFNGCEYTGTMLDPKGEALEPDPGLIMGYFADNCLENFTEEQVDLMKVDLQSAQRRAIRRDFTPTTSAITTAPSLIAPKDKFVTDSYNKVLLSWDEVPGASYYIIEMDKISSFTANSLQFIAYRNSFLLDDVLSPNRNYHWRVYAYNDATTCGTPSSTERFRTGVSTATPSIKKVNNLEVYPNPTKSKAGFTLSVDATASFDAAIKIFNFTGQLVWHKSTHTFTNGSSQQVIKTAQLTAGMYFVHLENSEGIITKKIIVQ